MEKIVITTSDVANIESKPDTINIKEDSCPTWWKVLASMMVLVPPLLFVIIILSLISNRTKPLSAKYSYSIHYCYLLLASGLLMMFSLLLLVNNRIDIPDEPISHKNTISFYASPKVPSSSILSGKDISTELSPAVVVLREAKFNGTENSNEGLGAGVIVLALPKECLIVTSRHIVDSISKQLGDKKVVEITLHDGQSALASVIGFHQSLDLALLYIHRDEQAPDFIQPIRQYATVEVGEQVYVIGHPEGLEFSISSGLVSQKRVDELLQVSAPVSPGNSGGPVYDSYGCLVGIVQSVMDKTIRPNAENLNFAVRADELLNSEKWTLTEGGKIAFSNLELKFAKMKSAK